MPPDISAPPPVGRGTIAAMAARLAREDYPPGDLAQLRRLSPDRPDGRAFWQLVARYAPAAFDDERLARALAICLRGMAIMREFLLGSPRRLGAALAEAGVSEQRVLRLLRADADRLDEELRQLARLLASKGEPGRFDWADAFMLVQSGAGTDGGDRLRRAIAGDYYRILFQTEKGHAA
jgi:CRISPR type I-E-associated protein CasB/Cse2